MLLIPALIVAVVFGLLGSSAALLAGFGWRGALGAYWLSGNIGLLATIMPRLLRTGPGETASGLASRAGRHRMLIALCWMMLGLGIIAWHGFVGHLQPRNPHGNEIGAVIGLQYQGSNTDYRYLWTASAPQFINAVVEMALRIPLWVMGALAYFAGLARLLVAAADRIETPGHG
ncbi:hypothetical protein [Paracoccus salsus]|uniref:hypothetical protein n=1 Tax=Paracoccus salsus TaxID=2911061 RepID=UPI001F2C7214|nr:hypothetical protein [Paracoccus salsus]MCF3974524.1 hypothetical protein [Paracoccus salsus]